MMTAEQDQVVDAGNAIVGPMVEVMDIAPMRESVAQGEDTSQIPGVNGSSEGRSDESFGAAHIQWLGFGVEDDPGQVGIAGETSDLVGGEKGPRSRL